MAPGRKLGESCWTCRLRRKHCDSVRPVCGSCQKLDITCHTGDARPSWMDAGVGQKHMSETIKRHIKQNAVFRRERRLLAHDDQDIVIITEKDFESSPTGSGSGSTDDSASRAISSQSQFTTPSWTSDPVTLPTGSSSAGLAIPAQAQLGSVMIYLDYVFPFLFPFYRPPLIETGRQWLLGLLWQNGVSFHTAASLSAYFFTLVPQSEEQEMHRDCKALVWDRLVGQMELAVQTIQNCVSAISRQGAHSSLTDKTRIMEEIVQLLIVEVTVRKDVDWTIHLTPALAIFDEVFKSHGLQNSEPSLAALLSALPPLSFPMATPHDKPLPNTADQSALVFFVSLLLFVDIVASTSLGKPPALQSYHHSLFNPQGEEKSSVRLESVIGCESWALVAIGEISALCAWKRDAKQSGNFSVVDLVNLAGPISQALDAGLAALDNNPPRSQPKRSGASRLEGYYSRHDRAIDHHSIANVTRVWAYAAKLYLSVVLSGWQTKSAEIQGSVAQVLRLLQTIDSPAQLRSLSWPICVAGCLALPTQEHEFRTIVASIGELGEFGTVVTALRIMEAVWSFRDMADGNVWDFASCLSTLGSPALLI